MSSTLRNINFSVGHEECRSLCFLDVKNYSKNYKLVTNVYKKQSFGGVFTNYEGFIQAYQKRTFTDYIGISGYAAVSKHFFWK